MNVEKLKELEQYADRLSAWTSNLIELETIPDLNIPDYAESREDYRLHIGNMIGSYRILLGNAYNAIDEWQNV